MPYYTYVDYEPNNYTALEASNEEIFTVKNLIDGAVHIVLYKNKSEPNRVLKELEKVSDLYGVIRSEVSVINVVLEIEYDKLIDFNYIYIEEFNRYYYVDDYLMVRHRLYELSLSVDVLMSYSSSILNLKAFVDRNENSYDKFLIDKKRVVEQGVDIETITIPNNVVSYDFDKTDYIYAVNGFGVQPQLQIQ